MQAVKNLGTPSDNQIRASSSRTTVAKHNRRLVKKAIDLIYKDGNPVNSKPVESLLRKSSLVPTEVKLYQFKLVDLLIMNYRMLSHPSLIMDLRSQKS